MKENEALAFLKAVRFYLYGDLSNFEKLCNLAETLENSVNENDDCTDDFYSSTTTAQTTSSPNPRYRIDSENTFFRSTIPHVLSVLTTADLVGFLLRDVDVKPVDTIGNLKEFYSPEIDKTEIEYLAFFYRNGLTHTYFPKKRFGIKAHSKNPCKLFFPENETIVLNVNYLIEITKQRFDSILKDSSSLSNLNDQFSKLEKHDDDEIKRRSLNIEEFKRNLSQI